MDQTQQLIELKKMLDQGLIDDQEFLKLKAEILSKSTTSDNYTALHASQPHTNSNNNLRKNSHDKLKRVLIFSIAILMVLVIVVYAFVENSTPKKDFIISSTDSSSQPIEEADTNRKNENPLKPPIHYNIPRQIAYSFPSSNTTNYIPKEFYPIGWSRNGKFAFLFIPANEASDCNYAELVIQDMVTDEIVYRKNSREYCDGNEPLFSRAWNDLSPIITPVLNQFQIEQVGGITINQLPYLYNGNRYDFHLYNRTENYYDYGQTIAAASVISLKVNGVLGKKVYGKTYGSSGPLYNGVVGYLKSPFENRIAAFYALEYRGYEGPPNVIDFELIGCMIQ